MGVTLHFQPTGAVHASGAPVTVQGKGITIGRGNENDLVLADPDRMLSKRHCTIEDHNGNVVILDTSTNGTFLNYGKLPLGATPTPLSDGDILSIGPYEIMVKISADADDALGLADPLDFGQISPGKAAHAPNPADLLDAPGDGGDFLDDLLGSSNAPVGPGGVDRDEPKDEDGLLPPLGEGDPLLPPLEDPSHGLGASQPMHNPAVTDQYSVPTATSGAKTIPDDWDDDLLNPADPFAEPFEDPSAQTPAAPSQPIPQPAPSLNSDKASRAFLEEVGAQQVQISDAELPDTMARMGKIMRNMIEGIREILMTRTSIKSEFRIEQTMIQAGGNNPLKFSISPEQAVQALVSPTAKGYLEATQAVTEAMNDIKAHEIAMVTGMESALKGVLARLDPSVLEEKITVNGGLGSVLKSKKARYWEIYETMYSEISDQAENDFHELFAREFARAYQEQLDKLK